MDGRKKFQENIPEHNPFDPDEACPVFIPRGVRDIMLDYVNSIELIHDDKEKKTPSKHAKFKLFGRGLEFFMNLNSIANHILHRDEKSLPDIIAKVAKNPILLFVKSKGVDALNREVEGTLIQIAAMSGNVDLLPNIRDENKKGWVEILQKAGGLTDQEVRSQLEPIFNLEAMRINNNRNELITARMTQFLNDILKVHVENKTDFPTLKQRCKPLAEQLEKDLIAMTRHITCGFVFDLHILRKVGEAFTSKLSSFGGWNTIHSALFWIYAFGILEKIVAATDAQIIKNGLKNYIERHILPNNDLEDYYHSDLGRHYCVDYDGNKYKAINCRIWAPTDIKQILMFDKLIENREKTFKKWVDFNPDVSFFKRFFS